MTSPLDSFTKSSHLKIVQSNVYTKRFFFFFRRNRLNFTTSDGKTYDLAVRIMQSSSQIPKKYFAIHTSGRVVLVHKNRLRKRLGVEKELFHKLMESNPSLKTLLRIKESIAPLTKTVSQQTAFNIVQFKHELERNLADWQDNFFYKKMADGRPCIVYRDHDKSLQFLVDVSFGSSLLGKGGTKRVYSYYNFQTQCVDRAVSIQHTSSGEEAARARQEIDLYEQLQDIPQMMKIKHSFENSAAGYFILIMKKYDGTWDHCLKKYSVDQNLLYFRQLVEGVIKIHKNNVIHRDLKFRNILYKTKPEGIALKIIDLGNACYKDDSEELSHPFGTSYYMPPEIMEGIKIFEPEKIDSWALGILLYRIRFKKRVPFAKKMSKLLQQQQRDQVRPLVEAFVKNHTNSKDSLMKVIVNLLQPDPTKRLSPMDALNAIDLFLALRK